MTIKKNIKKKFLKSASCLCGGIKIKIKGKLRHVNNCHCSQCMKTHGNYASYTACPEKNVVFVNKKTLKWFKSSKLAKRGFCAKCGASIFYKRFNSENISISAGMFKNPSSLKTYSNIFTKGKLDYYKLDPRLPKFIRYSK
tara:strand:+ start:301 stop:723 length:423 start_codon:yes stop_codon:yes gene_type:complete